MITTRTLISGIEYFDYKNLEVSKSMSDLGESSYFDITYDSPYGRHKTDFQVGQEIKIYADKDTTPATTNIFTGIVENVTFDGEANEQKVGLRGRDYTARLLDNTINPVVYTNMETGSIVRDIIKNNLTDIGSTYVNNSNVVLPRISFNQIPIYDGLKQLADLSLYTFYVDDNKELHFEPTGSVFSSIQLGSENILNMTFDKTREGMANKIWVYGDRYLAGA